jgi:cell division protein ZapD
VILYEYPFNERIRTYLRLEQLLRRFGELATRAHPIDHHYAVQTLFELMDVGSRSDLKSEIMKDIERHKQVLNGYRGNPALSEQALDGFIAELDAGFAALDADTGRFGQGLSENEWLTAIRKRMAMPGGTCGFDLPFYHDWLHRPVEARLHDLKLWSGEFTGLRRTLRPLLQLLRDSGMPQKVMAIAGQLQHNLPQGRSFQLLRLRLDIALGLVPEISGNRLMFSVRLLERSEEGRPRPCSADVPLEVTLCA